MKANAATIHARHVERWALHAAPSGVGTWSEAENPNGLLILRWIVGWGLLLVLAVVALMAVGTSVGPRAAAVPEVRRPSDGGMMIFPGTMLGAPGGMKDM